MPVTNTSNIITDIINQHQEHIPTQGDGKVNLSYQKIHLEIVDYHLDTIKPHGTDITYLIRGDKPASLEANQYFVSLGSAFTFGTFCQKPHGSILAEKLALPHLNLGFAGVGPYYFIKHHQLIEQYVNKAQFAVILVMSGRSESNALFASGGLESFVRKTDGNYVTSEQGYRWLMQNYDPDYVQEIVAETRNNWVKNYQQMLSMIKVPKILLWLSKRSPNYQENYQNLRTLFANFPQLVNSQMISEIKGYADEYVECISKRGSPQLLINRFLETPIEIKTRDGRVKTHNDYYASPEMQFDAAEVLEPVSRKYLQLPKKGKIIEIKAAENNLLEQAKKLVSQGKIDQATQLYLEVIKTQPNSPEAYGNLGSLFAQQQQWEPAIEYYQKALAIDPNLAGVYRNLARVLSQTEQSATAANYWYQALSLEPSWASATEYISLGNTLWEQGKQPEALICYRRSVELEPNSLTGYQSLTTALIHQGQYEQAVKYLQIALEFNSQAVQIHFKLANLYRQLNRFPEAVDSCLKVIELQPNLPKPYIYLRFNLLRYAIGDQSPLLDSIITACRDVIEQNSESIVCSSTLGYALTKQGKLGDAIACYQQASYQQGVRLKPSISKLDWLTATRKEPQFIVIGAEKCGTTSLYHYLSQHPQFLPSIEKELDFFDVEFQRGMEWYLAHFSPIPNQLGLVTGEVSANYLYSEQAPQRIRELLPQTKLIVLLRNPIERAASRYYMLRQQRLIKLSFEDKVIQEIQAIEKSFQAGKVAIETLNRNRNIGNSLYVYHLQRWLDIFPREQLLVVRSEDLDQQPAATLKKIYDYLEMPEHELPNYHKYNRGSYAPINTKIRHTLQEFFTPHNQYLETYLGRQFNWQ